MRARKASWAGLRLSARPGAIASVNSQIPESQVWARAKICVLNNLRRIECKVK